MLYISDVVDYLEKYLFEMKVMVEFESVDLIGCTMWRK